MGCRGVLNPVGVRGAGYCVKRERGYSCSPHIRDTAAFPVRGFASRARLYFAFTRPFTLLPPTFGVVSGALTAFGSAHNPDPMRRFTPAVAASIPLGSPFPGLLKAAGNVVNQ